MKLALYVALLWAVWHLPDHLAEVGWGVAGADLRRRRSWNATSTAPPGPAPIDSWN